MQTFIALCYRPSMLLSGLRGKNYGVEHVLAPFSGSLDEILDSTLGLRAEQVDFLFKMGALYLSSHRILLRDIKIEKDQYLRVHTQPRRFPTEVFDFHQALVEHTEDFVVVNKPSGLPVPPTVDNQIENIAHLLALHLQHEIHVTHRLDVGTSGLLILAKNKKFQSEINKLFMQHTLQLSTSMKPTYFSKRYRVLVHSSPTLLNMIQSGQNELIHFMEPSPRAPKVVSSTEHPGWALCRLQFFNPRVIELRRDKASDCSQTNSSSQFVELDVHLLTGRTHQIRVQFAAIGSPVVDDTMYGDSHKILFTDVDREQFCLQSCELSFSLGDVEKKYSLTKAPWQSD